MDLMTTKDKIKDFLLTMVIWITMALLFENFFSEDGFTEMDAQYWGGALIGYGIALIMHKIVKKKRK